MLAGRAQRYIDFATRAVTSPRTATSSIERAEIAGALSSASLGSERSRASRESFHFQNESARFVDAHHIEHWADGGATRLDNLVLLCRHHHRLVHEGGFSVVSRRLQVDLFA